MPVESTQTVIAFDLSQDYRIYRPENITEEIADDDITYIDELMQSSIDRRDLLYGDPEEPKNGYGIVSFSSSTKFRLIEEIFPDMPLSMVAVWLLKSGGYDDCEIWAGCGIPIATQQIWIETVNNELTGEPLEDVTIVSRLGRRFPGVPLYKISLWLLRTGGASIRRIERDTGIPRMTAVRWIEEVRRFDKENNSKAAH